MVVFYSSKLFIELNFVFFLDKVIKKIGFIKKLGGCGILLGRVMYMIRCCIVLNSRINSNKVMFIISIGFLNMGISYFKVLCLLESEKLF